jgi:hypothetical protein
MITRVESGAIAADETAMGGYLAAFLHRAHRRSR